MLRTYARTAIRTHTQECFLRLRTSCRGLTNLVNPLLTSAKIAPCTAERVEVIRKPRGGEAKRVSVEELQAHTPTTFRPVSLPADLADRVLAAILKCVT